MATLHRTHAFWDCPVAQAVVQQLQRGLGGQLVQRHHVWLVTPPSRAVQLVVWQIACLAALEAMDAGRRLLWRSYVAAGGAGVAALGMDTALVRNASEHAIACFWLTLGNFAASGPPPLSWASVSAEHPFLTVARPPAVQAPQLRVALPDGLIFPASYELLDDLV
jgi:hypothetical protein